MPTSFAANSLHALRRLLRGPSSSGAVTTPGAIMDGLSAAAFVEASMSDAAALGASYPASAGARLWTRRCAHAAINRFGRALSSVEAESPRGALSAAVGLAAGGERATVFLSGPDVLAGQDLLAQAVGLHVPLVVHLASRAIGGSGQALGTGHEALHAAAERGLFVLSAMNVQEAVDLTLIARRVTERSLVPGLVAMDAEQTALAAQEVIIPNAALVRAFVGDPAEPIEPVGEFQRLVFGRTRRRVPRAFDLEHPVMRGSYQGPESWGLGAAAGSVCFGGAVEGELTDAVREFEAQTGRDRGALRLFEVDDARIVIVAQGSAVETAIAVARWLRREERVRVGVVGVRRLRPFPASAVVEALRGARVAAILERVPIAPGGDGPLARDIESAFGRAREDAPRFVGVPFGLGGLPLRAADLAALVRELATPKRSHVYLGLDFVRSASTYPKREALMDTLRGAGPGLADLGLRAADDAPDVRPDGAVTCAIHRRAGDDERLAGAAAAVLHEAAGGFLRTRPGVAWPRSETPCCDVLTLSPAVIDDPGDDVRADIAVVVTPRPAQLPDLAARLADGGAILFATDGADAAGTLLTDLRAAIGAGRAELHAVSATPGGPDDALAPLARRSESLLGGLLAVFAARTGRAITVDQARAIRTATLEDGVGEADDPRLDAFVDAFKAVARVDGAESAAGAEPRPEPGVPPAMRGATRADGTLDCLASFWDRTGILYRNGDTDELTADPYAAFGAIPALAASFRDAGDACTRIPVFDPASCDGDPSLWTTCPDGSVAALVIAPRAIVDTGIDVASAAGRAVDTLRSVAPRLARGIARVAATADPPPTSAADLLRGAFEALVAKSDLSTERRAALGTALDDVIGVIGAMPLARTRVFFDEPEAETAGSGQFLTLAVNPDACRCPELLLARCAGHGLAFAARTPETIAAARAQWDLFWRLPDTPGTTIERARAHPDIGPMAGLMLSRHCAHAMAAGDGAEAGSGARLALRHVLAIAEYHAGPRLQAHLDDLDELRRKLADCIQAALATALPTHDLDALAEGLEMLGRKDVGLTDISARVDAAVEGGRVDGARLGRLVDAARSLADLHWRLSRGVDGRGRSRAGLVLAPDSTGAWAGVYPHNPFACPVIIDGCGESGDFARGLLEGLLRQLIAGFRARRWAQALLEDPDAPSAAAAPELIFGDLTDTERALCPPVILVGDGRSFGVRGLAQLTWLLRTGLPIKVLVLNGIGGAVAGDRGVDALAAYPDRQPYDIGLLAALGRRAFVAQTSPGDPDHFADSVLRAMAFDGPALVHVHTPSPERDGFDAERLLAQAEVAVATRAFPLFTFDPARDGVFGAKLDLAGNPALTEDWPADAAGKPRTPAEWYASERRFAARLTPEGPDAALANDLDERLRLWRTLQELAGVVTPFTATVREDAERAVAEAHRAKVQEVTDSYERRLAGLRAQFEREATERVTAGLLALAGHDAGGGGAEVTP